MTSLRIVFMGSPEIAIPSLTALVQSSHTVIGVVSQPDKPAGRGRDIKPPAVAAFAREHNLLLLQPESIKNNEPFIRTLSELRPDLIAIVAYGKILPKEMLTLPRLGCINVHFSILPKYRGAAPLQWSLINGDEETGVTIFRLDEGVDSGPILLQKKTGIHEEDNAEILGHRLSIIGAELLIETLDRLSEGSLDPLPQNHHDATKAPLLKKEDGRIDWTRKAKLVWGQIRGMTPWPGAYTVMKDKRLKVHAAEPVDHAKKGSPGEILEINDKGIQIACGQGALLIKELQLEGGKRLGTKVFLKGHPLSPGEKIG